jgi:sulfide:quinone oxidoreductase
MTATDRIQRRRVVIVGGGIAALEAVLALHDLADAQLEVTLIAPEHEFTLRALNVVKPFSRGHAGRLGLRDFMDEHGGAFCCDAVLRIDTERKVVECATGAEIVYDALIVAPGANARAAFDHGFTFGVAGDLLGLNGILSDLEHGWSRSVAFVVPEGCTWPLPLYELALMTADEVWGMNIEDVKLHLVTPESAPLAIFGADASDEVARLLAAAGVTLHTGAVPRIERNGSVQTGHGITVEAQRIVALPVLDGPRLAGLPADDQGFIPVDEYGRVDGLSDVYAAGDATDQPIKQGGLACQQADVIAAHIAAAAGATVTVEPLALVLRGRLITGNRDRFMRREVARSEDRVASEPLWWPPAKVASRYLAPYLAAHDLVTLPAGHERDSPGIEVRVALPRRERHRDDVLGLNTLG